VKKLVAVVLLIFSFTANAFAFDEFFSWINDSCFDVHLKPKGCIKIKHGKVKFGLKVTYWLPIGIMEVTDKPCDFSLGLPVLDQTLSVAGELCNRLPYLQSGSLSDDLTFPYSRYQVHVYSLPPALIPIIKQALMTTHFVPCFDFGMGDVLGVCSTCTQVLDRVLAPVQAVEGKIQSVKDKLKGAVDKAVPDFVKKRVKEAGSGDTTKAVQQAYQTLLSSVSTPVFFSELVSPIWNVDVLSPDAYTIIPVLNALVESGGILTEGACDLSTTLLRKKGLYPEVAGYDLSFVCVGNWGHGYPRNGIVRNDNPAVALPLAGARFLHLFSTNFPILRHLNPHSIKLQYVYPKKTGCFKIGDHSLPLTARGFDRHRAVFLIWKKFSCCDW